MSNKAKTSGHAPRCILAFMLALMMVMTTIPGMAYAEEQPDANEPAAAETVTKPAEPAEVPDDQNTDANQNTESDAESDTESDGAAGGEILAAGADDEASDLAIAVEGDVTTSSKTLTVNVTGDVPEGSMISIRGYKPDLQEINYDVIWEGNGTYNWNLGTENISAAGEVTVNIENTVVLTEGMQIVAYVLNDTKPLTHSEITLVKGTGSIADRAAAIMNNCTVQIIHDGDFKIDEKTAHVKLGIDPGLENPTLSLYACPGNVAYDSENITYFTNVYSGPATDGFDSDVTFNKDLPAYHRLVAVIRGKIQGTEDYYATKESNYVYILDENGERFKEYQYPDITIDESELTAGATTLHISMTGDERLFAAAGDPDVDFSIHYSIGMYPDGENFDFEGENQIALLNYQEVTEAFSGKEVSLSQPLREGYRVRAVAFWSQNTDLFVPKSNDYEFNQPDDSVLVKAESNEAKASIAEVFAGDKSCSITLSGDIPDGCNLIVKSYDKGVTEFPLYEGTAQGFVSGVSTGTIEHTFTNPDSITEDATVAAFILSNGDILASATKTVKAIPDPVVSIEGKVSPESTSIPVKVEGKVADGASLLLRMYDADETAFENSFTGSTIVSTNYASGITVASGTNELKVMDGVSLEEGKKLCVFLINGDKTIKSAPVTITSAEELSVVLGEIRTDSTEVSVDVNGSVPDGSILLVKSYSAGTTTFATDKGEAHGVTSSVAEGTINHTLTNVDKLSAGRVVVAFILNGGEAIAVSEPVAVVQGAYEMPTIAITDREITAGDAKMNFRATFDKALSSALYTVYLYEGESFDAESATVLAEGSMTISGEKAVYVYNRIKAGDSLIVVLTAGGETVQSEPIVVQPSPNWQEPEASFTVDKITDNATEIPVKVDYDDAYLDMEDFYCNISIYMFNKAVDDDVFEEDEYWEDPDKAKLVARANYSSGDQTRGEFSIPVLPSADLTAGKKLIIKVRVPHQEWEGEEADYLSSSVVIEPSSAFAKGPSAILYNVDFTTERGMTIKELLEENGIQYKVVTNEDLVQTIGYLIEKKGFEKSDEMYSGEGYKTEFLLMNGPDKESYDVFIADDTGLVDLMAAEDVSIPHKAMVTETNMEWTLEDLIDRIADEHAVMTGWMDLYSLSEFAKDLDEAVYGGTEAWEQFQQALDAAEELLREEDEDVLTEEALTEAKDNLQDAINHLTSENEAAVKALRADLSDLVAKQKEYTEYKFGKNSNWPVYVEALADAKALLADENAPAGSLALAYDKLSKAMKKLDRVAERMDKEIVDLPAVKIKKVSKGKKAFTAKWKKPTKKNLRKISNIQVMYSTTRDFSSGDTKLLTVSKKAKSKKVKGLQKKKTYYVRVRAYNKIDGQIHVSKWSAVKKVRTK
ncbi:MAG: DUF3783 domain-containing protein [Bacillota bacterium]|nr:DUF3783 domain-containing protein [Bacillota bacterium]